MSQSRILRLHCSRIVCFRKSGLGWKSASNIATNLRLIQKHPRHKMSRSADCMRKRTTHICDIT
ncbi:hypothetical protein ACMD2_20988 [Ananas comosus]|uniref:Uncharacterized protein n=1 Tax=Ananas comosus TaxID=4615 RepID=A0A199VTH4_ANACO|nr:hypothetical protein ACMD2_20988 [Ananas comosus]